IQKNLNDGEKIVHCIRTHRTFHNAKRFNDKNMFFSSRCILTDSRLLIIRNLEYFKLFREINLSSVNDCRIQKSDDDLVIKLLSGGSEYIIEFSKHALIHADEFSKVLEHTLRTAKDKYPLSETGHPQKKCSGCGKLSDLDSQFCSQCGYKFG
nr:hypothetical protein [Candidatus Dadabacteria bacterium]